MDLEPLVSKAEFEESILSYKVTPRNKIVDMFKQVNAKCGQVVPLTDLSKWYIRFRLNQWPALNKQLGTLDLAANNRSVPRPIRIKHKALKPLGRKSSIKHSGAAGSKRDSRVSKPRVSLHGNKRKLPSIAQIEGAAVTTGERVVGVEPVATAAPKQKGAVVRSSNPALVAQMRISDVTADTGRVVLSDTAPLAIAV